MQNLELEREFNQEASRHIKAVLVEKMRRYYETLNNTGIKLPKWQQEDALKMADIAVRNFIARNDYTNIISLYEQAYKEIYNV